VSRHILDSSAILAFLQQEPGSELVMGLIPDAMTSAVNAAEAQTKLIRNGMPAGEARIALHQAIAQIVAFDSEQADIAAALILETRALGLSLGDRACLALGLVMKYPVYTADRAWAQLQVGVNVRLVR
jgi:PIN domain nuclease of toxin-antitoxin system